MSIARTLRTKTLFAEATVSENGSLTLDETTLFSLKPGTKVSLMISPILESDGKNTMPLKGTVTRYDDPFGSAADVELLLPEFITSH